MGRAGREPKRRRGMGRAAACGLAFACAVFLACLGPAWAQGTQPRGGLRPAPRGAKAVPRQATPRSGTATVSPRSIRATSARSLATVDAAAEPQPDRTLPLSNDSESEKMSVLKFRLTDPGGDRRPVLMDELIVPVRGTGGHAAHDIAWAELAKAGARVATAAYINDNHIAFGATPDNNDLGGLDTVPDGATVEYTVYIHLAAPVLAPVGSTYVFDADETNVGVDRGKSTQMWRDSEAIRPVVCTVGGGPTPVVFPDPNLDAAVRAAIGKPSGDIFDSDLVGFVYLEAPGGVEDSTKIADLTGLDHCLDLQHLGLPRNRIAGLEPLAGLTGLTYLNLTRNRLAGPEALAPLAGLTRLAYLNVAVNEVESLSPLQGMTGLRYLLADYNRVSSIAPVAGMTQLIELWLRSNRVTDLAPLAGKADLTVLHLSGNTVSDLAPLAGCTSLVHLFLGANAVSDLGPLRGLTNLKQVNLFTNRVSDLQPLVDNAGLAAGDFLNVATNPLTQAARAVQVPALQARGVTVVYTGTAAPNPPAVSGPAATNELKPTWTWVPGGGGAGTFICQLDGEGGTWAYTQALRFTPPAALSEGTHTLYVRERNAAGQWSVSGSWTVAVDRTPPGAPAVTGTTPSPGPRPTWSWTSGGGCGVYRYRLDNPDTASGAVETAGAAYTPAEDLSRGVHTLYVQERDEAGNWSAAGAFAITVAAGPPQGLGVLWGCTTGDHGEIFRVNLADGSVTARKDFGPVRFGDIAADPRGECLYAAHGETVFDKLSQVDCATLAIRRTWTLPEGVSLNALAWKAGAGDTLYGIQGGGADASTLYEITVGESGIEVQSVGDIPAGGSSGDLDCDADGNWVAAFMADDVNRLWHIDPLDPAAGVAGPVLGHRSAEVGRVHVDALAYDWGGTLWGASRDTNDAGTYGPLEIYTVDGADGPAGLPPVWDLGGALSGDGITGLCRAASVASNGSFESGADPGAAVKLGPGSTALDGWTVGGNGVYYVGTYYQAGDGSRCVKLTLQYPGWIEQAVDTTPGCEYEVAFRMAGDPFPHLTPEQKIKTLRVDASAGGTAIGSQQFSFDTTGRGVTQMGWEERSWRFTALSARTTLRFTGVSPGPYGPCIDQVRVAPAP